LQFCGARVLNCYLTAKYEDARVKGLLALLAPYRYKGIENGVCSSPGSYLKGLDP
jgi:hypothetical protein